MSGPIDPTHCKTTGRLLTEWFEYPEFTDEDLKKMALAHAGVDAISGAPLDQMAPEQQEAFVKYRNFLISHKNRKWKHNMTQQEVAARMNEASKMIEPDNFKFLDDQTRERTGLEINPLWMMECLIRSGTLTPKEQVAALKELAQYTHSKAPNINHNTNINNPEDWLLELSKAEYAVVDDNPSFQPKQPREVGMAPEFERKKEQRVKLMHETQALMASEANTMAQELGDYNFGDEDAE